MADKVANGTYVGDLADYTFDYNVAPAGAVAIYPVTAKGDPCVWRLIGSRMMSDWEKGYIKVVPINSTNTENKYTIQYLSGGIISKIESGEFETAPAYWVIYCKCGGKTRTEIKGGTAFSGKYKICRSIGLARRRLQEIQTSRGRKADVSDAYDACAGDGRSVGKRGRLWWYYERIWRNPEYVEIQFLQGGISAMNEPVIVLNEVNSK